MCAFFCRLALMDRSPRENGFIGENSRSFPGRMPEWLRGEI